MAVRTRWRVSRRPLIAVGCLFCYMSWIGFVALDHLDTSLYIVLVYVYPAFVAAAAPLFGQRIPLATWLAIGVTIVGISLTVPDVFEGAGRGDAFGVVLTLGASGRVGDVHDREQSGRDGSCRRIGDDGLEPHRLVARHGRAGGRDRAAAAERRTCRRRAHRLRDRADDRVGRVLLPGPAIPRADARRRRSPRSNRSSRSCGRCSSSARSCAPIQVVGGVLVLVGVIWAQRSAGQVVAVARRRSTRKREKTSSWSM